MVPIVLLNFHNPAWLVLTYKLCEKSFGNDQVMLIQKSLENKNIYDLTFMIPLITITNKHTL